MKPVFCNDLNSPGNCATVAFRTLTNVKVSDQSSIADVHDVALLRSDGTFLSNECFGKELALTPLQPLNWELVEGPYPYCRPSAFILAG